MTVFSSKVEALDDDWSDALDYFQIAQGYRVDAYTHYVANEDHEAIFDICIALNWYEKGMYKMACGYSSYVPPPDLPEILRLCWEYEYTEMPEFDLTMTKIISAMILSIPAEIEFYIGLNDAFRQSLWDKPFNQSFFAELARAYREWA